MRAGVRIGVDVGTVRVGVAVSDPEGLLATPLATVRRDPAGDSDVEQIAGLVRERHSLEVIVGLPLTLAGDEGSASGAARAYAGAVARRVAPVPVRLVDERMSTVTAHRALGASGVSQRRRRPVVDQAAAVVILQGALDAERASGRPPGTLVVMDAGPESPDPRQVARRPGA